MQFFNKRTLAFILLILLINSQIILSNVKINRKKIKLTNKSKYKTKIICKDELSQFNYVKFFITAILRAKSSFTDQVAQAFEKLLQIDQLSKQCTNQISVHLDYNVKYILNEKNYFMNRLNYQIAEIENDAIKIGLDQSQIADIKHAYGAKNPRKTCEALHNSIKYNTDNSSDKTKDLLYKIELLDSMIFKVAHNNPYKPYYITIDQIFGVLDDCSIIGFLLQDCSRQQSLWQEINKRNSLYQEDNFYYFLVNLKAEFLYEYNFLINQISRGEVYLGFDCDLLPDNDMENDVCIKANTYVYIKALWLTISNMRQNGILNICWNNMTLFLDIDKLFTDLLKQVFGLVADIFGFFVIRGIKFLWNLGVLLFYLYKAFSNQDNVDLFSEYLGECAGAAIRLIIDLFDNKVKKRRLHRHRKI